MKEQRNEMNFRGQKTYVGIDVHLKSWAVTVLSETSVLKKFSQHPDPEVLHRFLTRSYPRAEYHTEGRRRLLSLDFRSGNSSKMQCIANKIKTKFNQNKQPILFWILTRKINESETFTTQRTGN